MEGARTGLPPPPPPPPATPAALSVSAPQAEAAGAVSPGAAARAGLNQTLGALGERLGGAWDKYKSLGAEAPSEPKNDDHLYADGAVFGAFPRAGRLRSALRAPALPPPGV